MSGLWTRPGRREALCGGVGGGLAWLAFAGAAFPPLTAIALGAAAWAALQLAVGIAPFPRAPDALSGAELRARRAAGVMAAAREALTRIEAANGRISDPDISGALSRVTTRIARLINALEQTDARGVSAAGSVVDAFCVRSATLTDRYEALKRKTGDNSAEIDRRFEQAMEDVADRLAEAVDSLARQDEQKLKVALEVLQASTDRF